VAAVSQETAAIQYCSHFKHFKIQNFISFIIF
jgi:hypothetical protein